MVNTRIFTITAMSIQQGKNEVDVFVIHSEEEKPNVNSLNERLESYDLSLVSNKDTKKEQYCLKIVSSKCLIILSESSHNRNLLAADWLS